MSGVNAHAVLCPAESQQSAEQSGSLIWRRLRNWFAPAYHAMLANCTKLGGSVTMVAKFDSPTMAYLQDHQV